jgi:N-acylglucosamine 2-epimerase
MVRVSTRNQARSQLEHTILPFWLERGIDRRHGGYHTCFDNRGRNRVSTDKFTWSQGRFVWMLAHASELADQGKLTLDSAMLEGEARQGAQFLTDHAIRQDATCHFRLTRTGEPLADSGPARSVYADCFVIMGLAELARVTDETRWLDIVAPVLDRTRADILAGTAPTPPYDVPPGYQAFGPRMILLNTLLTVTTAEAELGCSEANDHRAWLSDALELVMAHRLTDGTFAEMVGPHHPDDDSLVARHRVPGHAIEGLWVALEAMELLDVSTHRDAILDSAIALFELGWDPVFGGLLRYTDSDGPSHPLGLDRGSDYEDLVKKTWSTKLWWVHSEAAATSAIASARYGSASAADWFHKIWNYMLATFPGGDDGEEWIQIRDRQGRPFDEVVALPVKDPFHLTRNLMQIIDLEADPGEATTAPLE